MSHWKERVSSFVMEYLGIAIFLATVVFLIFLTYGNTDEQKQRCFDQGGSFWSYKEGCIYERKVKP